MKSISKSEMAVMDVLWQQGARKGSSEKPQGAPMGASEIAQALSGQKDWSIRTVKTLLARLVEKGILQTQPEGRRYLYRPALSREAYGGQVIGSMSQQLFKGRTAPLFLHLAKSEDLSDQDIDEITALLAAMKSGKSGKDAPS